MKIKALCARRNEKESFYSDVFNTCRLWEKPMKGLPCLMPSESHNRPYSKRNMMHYSRKLHTPSQHLIRSMNSSIFHFASCHLPPSWITRERPDWDLVSPFRFGQQSNLSGVTSPALTGFARLKRFIYNHAFVLTIFLLVSLFKCWSRQINAYNNSSKKVSINLKRITFDLMPYCLQNEERFTCM